MVPGRSEDQTVAAVTTKQERNYNLGSVRGGVPLWELPQRSPGVNGLGNFSDGHKVNWKKGGETSGTCILLLLLFFYESAL